jgi:signal transduction histidine kinase
MRYRLTDIDHFIDKAMVFVATMSCFSLIGVSLAKALSELRPSLAIEIHSIVLVLVTVCLYRPVLARIERAMRRFLRCGGDGDVEHVTNLFTAKLMESENELSVYRALLDAIGTTVVPRAAHVIRQTVEGPVLLVGDPLPQVETISVEFDTTPGDKADPAEKIAISLPEYQSGVSVALTYQSSCFGHLVLQNKRNGRAYSHSDQHVVARFCAQAAMALENYRLREQRVQQQHDMDREREVIAREIHDGLGAALTNISFLCRSFDEHAPEESQQFRRIVGSIRCVAQQAKTVLYTSLWSLENEQKTCRDLFELIRNTVFAPALEAAHLKLHIHDHVPPATAILNPAIRMQLVRVVQEVMQNILKYAHAQHVTCKTDLMGSWLTMTIEDDGVGFCVEERKAGHYGLLNIRKRMREIDGFVVIESTPGHGTRVTLRVPIACEIPYLWDRSSSADPYSELQTGERGPSVFIGATKRGNAQARGVAPVAHAPAGAVPEKTRHIHNRSVAACNWIPKTKRSPIAYDRPPAH